MKILLTCVLALLLAGCYNREVRVNDRVAEKIEKFSAENGREPNAAELAKLKAEAQKEEDEFRAREIEQAKKDALSGAISLTTGNYVGGALLLVGAIGAFLGLNRTKKAEAKEGGAA